MRNNRQWQSALSRSSEASHGTSAAKKIKIDQQGLENATYSEGPSPHLPSGPREGSDGSKDRIPGFREPGQNKLVGVISGP